MGCSSFLAVLLLPLWLPLFFTVFGLVLALPFAGLALLFSLGIAFVSGVAGLFYVFFSAVYIAFTFSFAGGIFRIGAVFVLLGLFSAALPFMRRWLAWTKQVLTYIMRKIKNH